MLRVARAPSGRLEVGRGPGRGAYVHRDPVCVAAALAKGRLARALRATLRVEEEDALREELICQLR